MSLLRRLLSRSFRWLIAAIWFLCRIAIIAWAALAIYYSNLPSAELRLGLAVIFPAFIIWALWLSRQRSMSAIAIVLLLIVAAWWIAIPPSHDRNWRPEVAVMPRAVVDGDRVRLTGVRNFDYRTRNDFTVRYEEREVLLSHLIGLDFYVSYFTEGPVGPARSTASVSARATCASPVCATLITAAGTTSRFAMRSARCRCHT